MIGKIILASGSPRRRELLAGLGWNFEVIPPQVDEKKIDGEPPAELVKRLAEEGLKRRLPFPGKLGARGRYGGSS